MATIFSHPAVVLVLAAALPASQRQAKLLFAAALCTILPDADVLAFKFGIAYADHFGHRGATHSILFALFIGSLAAGIAPQLKSSRLCAFLVCAIATASHALLDACTTGGLGVALLWPWDGQRYFMPWQFIQVSPIGARFFSARGLAVLSNELLTIWLPALALSASLLGWRALFSDRSGRT